MKKVTRDDCVRALQAANGNKTQASKDLGISRSTFRMLIGSTETTKVSIEKEYNYLKKIKEQNAVISDLLARNSNFAELENIFRACSDAKLNPPKWLIDGSGKKTKKERAIATAFLSDCHFDEVVYPEQINYINAYNREIAILRLQKFFQNTLKLSKDYISGIELEGLVLPLGGDILSGDIHEELKETNEDSIIESALFWAEQIAAGIRLLEDQYPSIHIPCVVGNHGRLSRKPVFKNRVQTNMDYLVYKLLEKDFCKSKNITFDVSRSPDCKYNIYQTRYLLTHGDQFNGGSGIAGILSPLLLGDHRKRKREMAVGSPFDVMICGHWHQLTFLPGLIINGTTKGIDEYAFGHNFNYEPPQQAFWLTDPKHGKTIHAPIHVEHENEKD